LPVARRLEYSFAQEEPVSRAATLLPEREGNVNSVTFGTPLPAANDSVDIKWIEFHAAADSSGALGGDDSGP